MESNKGTQQAFGRLITGTSAEDLTHAREQETAARSSDHDKAPAAARRARVRGAAAGNGARNGHRSSRKAAKLPPGVGRVRLKSGVVRYRGWVPMGSNGQKKWTRVHDTPEAAYAHRCELMKLDKETPEEEIDVTLQQGVDRVTERLATTRREGTVRWFKHSASVLTNYFGGDTVLSSITARDIEAFRDMKIRAKVKPRSKDSNAPARNLSAASIAHYRRALSMVFKGNKAALKGKNPMDDVDGWPSVEQKEMHFFSSAEVADILSRIRASGDARAEEDVDLVSVLFLTGWRRSELARLTVEQIDFKKRVAWITGKKANERVALAPQTMDVLKRMVARVEKGPLVPLGVDHIGGVFKKWARLLKEPRLHPHTMRHSFVTQLVRSGLSMPVVQRLSRHRTLSMVAKYFHGSEDDAAALASVSLR